MSYRTSDTPLAAYLITQGFLPSLIDYSSPPRYEIVFANASGSIHELASQYIAGLAKVEPISYHRVNRKLNHILKNKLQWGND